MTSTWAPEMHIRKIGESLFLGDLNLSSDSPWFDGHFPKKPVLPAVAIVSIVLQLVRQSMEKPNLFITAIPRSRIRGLLLPGQQIEVRCEIEITESFDKSLKYSVRFEVKRQGERVGDGRMEVGQVKDNQSPLKKINTLYRQTFRDH